MMSLPAGQTVQSPPRDNNCSLKCPFTSFCFVFLFDSHPFAWKHQRSPGLQGLNVGEIDPTNADICFFFPFFIHVYFCHCRTRLFAGACEQATVLGLHHGDRGEERRTQTWRVSLINTRLGSHDSMSSLSCCTGPLEMRICQNFSGCWWAPHPHPAQ